MKYIKNFESSIEDWVTISKKYFIFYNQVNTLIFCEVTRKTPKSIFFKHIGYINNETKEILSKTILIPTFSMGPVPNGTISGYETRSNYDSLGKEFKIFKNQKFDIVYQTDDYDELLKQFDFGFKDAMNKYNL